jgi:hypothetical protein
VSSCVHAELLRDGTTASEQLKRMKPPAALDSHNFNISAGVDLVDAMAEVGLALALCALCDGTPLQLSS